MDDPYRCCRSNVRSQRLSCVKMRRAVAVSSDQCLRGKVHTQRERRVMKGVFDSRVRVVLCKCRLAARFK
eukprot:720976-Amphidinium_carterae.1